MTDELITKLEEQSIQILDNCLHEIKASGSGEIKKVPDDELRASLYILLLRVIEYLRQTVGATTTRASDFRHVFLEGMKIVVDAIDSQSAYTTGHSTAVARHAAYIASRLKMNEAQISEIEYAARIHNIGLINESQRALTIARVLSQEELQQARNHCVVGAEIVRPIEFLNHIAPMIRYHHTRYDGTGFPGGIGGEQLPMGACIIAVADAFQAMISARPHRPAMSREQALLEIDKGSGKEFDPQLAPIAHELN